MRQIALILVICFSTASLAIAAVTDPDKWVIVKNLITNTCAVLGTKPHNKNLVTIATFKALMTGGKAMNDMVVVKCGCNKSCNFELPR